jgi:LuxR family maltose regulon positive regulatory protein
MGLQLTAAQANLFLLPLDDECIWYRYHHLFADVLRTRLQQTYSQLAPELYRRACAWCADHDLLPEAIQHALALQDYTRTAQLIERFNLTFSPILPFYLIAGWGIVTGLFEIAISSKLSY